MTYTRPDERPGALPGHSVVKHCEGPTAIATQRVATRWEQALKEIPQREIESDLMSENGWKKRWEKVQKLGEGGQGPVFQVRDTDKVASTKNLVERASQTIRELASATMVGQQGESYRAFEDIVHQIVERDDPTQYGALKILHEPQDARDPVRAAERISREIKAMASVTHPNLLRILDASAEEKWYVSEYHPKGTLDQRIELFKGDVESALSDFQGLVSGVAHLHEQHMVHRDIKPKNVFFSEDGQLVLGDFGLVFFEDETRNRLSGTLQNVGTRDWMPPWAMGMRIEDITPRFDVFSLGKVLWSMISGQAILQLWYYHKPQFNLEKLFPDASHMSLANALFAKCIVENEEDCLADANELLAEVGRALKTIEVGGDILAGDVRRPCRACGQGEYELTVDLVGPGLDTFGLRPERPQKFRVFTCNNCGHVDLFSAPEGKLLAGWKDG